MTDNSATLKQTLYFSYTLFYIFGGVIPYIPQYLEIRRLQSIKGFSPYVCLALLIANLLRVLFWFVKPFSQPLLIQSIVMIIAMLVMMHLVVHVLQRDIQSRSPPIRHRVSSLSMRRTIWADPVEFFWNWTDFTSYFVFLLFFVCVMTGITSILSDRKVFVDLLGFAALFIEALLGLPQLVKNYQNKSTKGMSLMMVVLWTAGDVSKSIFFLLERAPLQFPLCGCLQIAVDLIIFMQHFYYTYRAHS